MATKNVIAHVEWRSRDAARLVDFYRSLFAWKFSAMGDGYTVVDMGSKEGGGGIMQLGEGMPIPPGMTSYIYVDDLAATEETVKAHGGKIMMSNQPVEGRGWFTVFADPDGNSMALWKSAPSERAPKKAAKKAAKAQKKAAKAQKKAAKAEKKPKKKEGHHEGHEASHADAKADKKAHKKAEKKAHKKAEKKTHKKAEKKTHKKADKHSHGEPTE